MSNQSSCLVVNKPTRTLTRCDDVAVRVAITLKDLRELWVPEEDVQDSSFLVPAATIHDHILGRALFERWFR